MKHGKQLISQLVKDIVEFSSQKAIDNNRYDNDVFPSLYERDRMAQHDLAAF